MLEVQISWDAENDVWLVRCFQNGELMGDTWQAWSETGSCAYDKARRFALSLGARNVPITWLHRRNEAGEIVAT